MTTATRPREPRPRGQGICWREQLNQSQPRAPCLPCCTRRSGDRGAPLSRTGAPASRQGIEVLQDVTLHWDASLTTATLVCSALWTLKKQEGSQALQTCAALRGQRQGLLSRPVPICSPRPPLQQTEGLNEQVLSPRTTQVENESKGTGLVRPRDLLAIFKSHCC